MVPEHFLSDVGMKSTQEVVDSEIGDDYGDKGEQIVGIGHGWAAE